MSNALSAGASAAPAQPPRSVAPSPTMFRALICLEDKLTADVVKTAFKQFPSMTAYPIPRENALEHVGDGQYQVVVVDLDNDGICDPDFVAELRAANPQIEILALIDRDHKERFNRLKVELGLFSCVPMPLDPFELARRLMRLEKHLSEKGPLVV
jgi:CheY-like chemotaxis protein